ncbi:MAG: hypothetical protein ACKORK_11005 [Gemmatimonadota bacterium]
MPVPLPHDDVLREPPSHDEVVTAARAKMTAVAGAAELADIQRNILRAHIRALTGVDVHLDGLEPLGPSAFAEAMRRCDEVFRIRQVQTMLLAAFVLDPRPEDIVERIREYALELSIDDAMIDVVRRLANEHRDLAMADFMRSGYHAHPERPLDEVLHVHRHLHDEWDAVDDDPHAFSLLASVIGLFETGRLERATIFEHDPHHMSQNSEHMAIGLADATRRSALIGAHIGGRDLLAVDWFEHAAAPIDDVRALIGVPPQSADALAAGSVGPWEIGGISEFQLAFGRHAAEARGEPYDAHGAAVRTA